MRKCKHIPDTDSIIIAYYTIEKTKAGFRFTVDVWCKKCGRSTGIPVDVLLSDLDWDD
jgi:rRNA maturation protein Nop10